MNPRLYSYIENFTSSTLTNLTIKKIIKEHFRSAWYKGIFSKKKGFGFLNTELSLDWTAVVMHLQIDTLLGPILEEFKQKKFQLIQSSHELMIKALAQKNALYQKTNRF
jgi:hypothetical protein